MRIKELRVGASPEQWDHFANTLSLYQDMYPVVCEVSAKIDEGSEISSIGRIPTRYNANKKVVGIADWPRKNTTEQEIKTWSANPDYGFCINCRTIRAFDVDVEDKLISDEIKSVIREYLPDAPIRFRENSNRFLIAFRVSGKWSKVSMPVNKNGPKDIIEFLADGQQFQATGLHTKSYTYYQWQPELPTSFPELSTDDLRSLWQRLTVRFGIGDVKPMTEKLVDRQKDPTSLGGLDDVGVFIKESSYFRKDGHNGELHIFCPWRHEHSDSDSESVTGTTYFPPSNGYEQGHFKCLHGHCSERTDNDFLQAIGYYEHVFEAPSTKLEVTETGEKITNKEGEVITKAVNRFAYTTAEAFSNRTKTEWFIKGILPKGELSVLYGESGSGKSFFALDMMMAVAKGEPWNGKKTNIGRIVYICAEGQGGFATRLQAYKREYPMPDDDHFHIIPAAPNLMTPQDTAELIKAIKHGGHADIVVVDTLAQVTPGSNENTSEDIGKALTHCKAIRRATGAMVLLIHHSGKDALKGARGWSGLKAACDAELEITREEKKRFWRVSKLKDGEETDAVEFQLNPVWLGDDEDGDRITSCVVEYLDAKKKKVVNKDKIKRSINEGYCDMLRDAFQSLALAGNVTPSFLDLRQAVFDVTPPFDNKDVKIKTTALRKALNTMQVPDKGKPPEVNVNNKGKFTHKDVSDFVAP